MGSDTFVNQVLRPYVELFSSKPPDWRGFIKFFIIPLGVNTVSKHIGKSIFWFNILPLDADYLEVS